MSNPIVTFEMENGDIIKAELYPEVAPNTVNNFISLVSKGFYDGLIFHRVIPGGRYRRRAERSGRRLHGHGRVQRPPRREKFHR